MLDQKSKEILQFVKVNPSFSSKEIYDSIDLEIGYATVKRILSKLIAKKLLLTEGKGRGTKYVISTTYQLFFPIEIEDYFKKDIDRMYS